MYLWPKRIITFIHKMAKIAIVVKVKSGIKINIFNRFTNINTSTLTPILMQLSHYTKMKSCKIEIYSFVQMTFDAYFHFHFHFYFYLFLMINNNNKTEAQAH